LSLLFSKYSFAPSPYALESVRPARNSAGRHACQISAGWPHTGKEEHSEVHRHMAPRSAHRAAPKPGISPSWSCHPSHRLMQLLPRGVQELPRRKEKPHRSSSWTSRSCYRCGSPGFGLGSGLGSSGVLRYVVPGKIRVLFVLRQTRQTATAIAIPGKTIMKTLDKETPLPQQTRESHVGGDRKSNNRLPQARRCASPLVFRLAGYSRGQVGKVASSIQPDSKQFDGHVD
jgi:hypothetical protein